MSSSDDITLDFTKSMISMHRFGGNEYFLTEKSFLFKIFVNHSLKLVLGKLGKAELKLVLDQPSVPNALLDLRIGKL